MADKTEKKPENREAVAEAPKDGEAKPTKGGVFKSTPFLLGVVMVLEAGIIIAAMKIMGGSPGEAAGANVDVVDEHAAGGKESAADKPAGKWAELPVVDFRAPNKRSGRTFLYDVSIFVEVRKEHEDAVKAVLKERDALIKDRIRTIIAQSDPDRLGGGGEPGLETLRRQIKYQLDEIVGEGMINNVLVPKCIPFRTEF